MNSNILQFLLKNKIKFNYQTPAIKKYLFFYNLEDIKKTLSYIYKSDRKLYYKLQTYYKKTHSFENKIFCNYSNNYSDKITSYYIVMEY